MGKPMHVHAGGVTVVYNKLRIPLSGLYSTVVPSHIRAQWYRLDLALQ